MTFPIINHIDDVLPHVSGRQDFIVAQRQGYTYIDYLYAAEDTFSGPSAEYRRECRGLKFAPSGELIARPYHKFHNLGENETTQAHGLPWVRDHKVLAKLDGSMIHPAMITGETRLMTRAGLSEVALQAEKWMGEDNARFFRYLDFCHAMEHAGLTPIFEYVAPTNQIVVRYAEANLILTGIRHKNSGEYFSDDGMRVTAAAHRIPVVDAWGGSTADLSAFIAHTRALEGAEGYVVRWDSGLMVKLKADDYVLRHKARDGLQHEKNVLALVLHDKDDDVIAMLPAEEAERLREYAAAVRESMVCHANRIEWFVNNYRTDRKTFATEALPNLPRLLHPIAWAVYDDRDALTALKALMMKHLGSQTDVDKIRDIIGVKWNG